MNVNIPFYSPLPSCWTSVHKPVGTCLAYSPDRTNAFTVNSCLNGWRTSLKVPSTYHVLVRARMVSCSCLANSRWRLSLTSMSARRKPSGIQSSTNSKSRSLGCSGRSFWRRRLAARAMYSGLGRAAHGASASSSSRTYQ